MKYTMRFAQILMPAVGGILLIPPAWGQGGQDRVSFGQDIVVEQGESVGDAVCIGCSIRVEGTVTGDAVAVGGGITVSGRVKGDAVTVGGETTVSGRVAGDVVAVGGRIRLKGAVDGDVVAMAGAIELGPGAAVGGDAVGVFGGVEGVRDGRVAGEVGTIRPIAAGLASIFVVVLVLCLITALIIQPLLALSCAALLGPQRLDVLARTAASRGLMSFLVGAGVLTTFLLLSLAGIFIPLWIPGIGLPLTPILFVPLVVGYAGISYWVGHGLLPQVNTMLAAFLGAVLVTILQMIPIVGWIAFVIFFPLALGVAVTSGFGTAVEWMDSRFKRRAEAG